MSKPALACFRTTSWSEDNEALWPVWLSAGLAGAREMEQGASPSGRLGRFGTYSEVAIPFCLSLKVLFGLALRQSLGRVGSLARGWPVCRTGRCRSTRTLCWRQRTVPGEVPQGRAGGHLNLLVDSTGATVRGEGEGQGRKHGPSCRRPWRKVHLAMEVATGEVRAVEVTPSPTGDSPVLPDLLEQIPPGGEPIGTVTADGA